MVSEYLQGLCNRLGNDILRSKALSEEAVREELFLKGRLSAFRLALTLPDKLIRDLTKEEASHGKPEPRS